MPAPRAVAADGKPDFPDVQLHIVTGKGGTGKTTVAAALALGLAAHGKTVLLCETEGRQGIAQLLRRPAAALRGAPRRPGRDDRCRRRLRAGDRPRVGVHGVPLDVLPARPRREGPRPVRGDRVRDDDRARRTRRAADREDLRGRQAQPTQQGRPPLRRDRAGCPADRADRAVPQRQQRARRPGQGGSDQVAGRQRHQPPPLEGDRDPPGHPARGDAGRGDRRRHRRAHRSRPAGRRRDREHGSPPGPRRRGAPAAARGQRRPRRAGRQPGERRAVRPRTTSSTR